MRFGLENVSINYTCNCAYKVFGVCKWSDSTCNSLHKCMVIDNAFVIIRRITSLYVPIFFYLFKMSGILSE